MVESAIEFLLNPRVNANSGVNANNRFPVPERARDPLALPKQSAKEFLSDIKPKETVLAQAKFPKRVRPIWMRALDIALGSHVDIAETDDPIEPEEITFPEPSEAQKFLGETPEPIIRTETAKLNYLEDPTGAALAAAVFPVARGAQVGVTWGTRIGRAFADYVGWTTGGVTDVPRLAATGAKVSARAASAKRLEKTLAPALKTAEKGLGVKPVKVVKEVPTGAAAGAGRIAESETEQIRGIFKERFKEPAKTVDVTKEPAKLIQTDVPKKEVVELYHGSPSPTIDKIDKYYGEFDGNLFFSAESGTAEAFGKHIHKIKVNKSDIIEAKQMFYNKNHRKAAPVIDEVVEKLGVDKETARNLIDETENIFDVELPDDYLLKGMDRGELSWWLQARTAEAAQKMGFRAVGVTDEVGHSYMVNMMGKEKDFIKATPKPKPKIHESVSDPNKLYGGLPIDFKALGKTWQKIGEPAWDALTLNKIPDAIKNAPFVGPPAAKAFSMLKESPPVKIIKRALVREYRGDLPDTAKFLSSLDDMRRGQGIGREYAIDLGTRLQAFPEETQLKMGQFITGQDVKLSGKELAAAEEAKLSMLDLGRQAVDQGLLAEETFFKNAGQYMPRLYTSKEYQGLLTNFKIKKPNRLDLQRFKRRKDIPKEIREEMGEILKPGFPIAKGVTQLTHDIEMSRFFGGVASNPEWALSKEAVKGGAAIPDGWKQLGGKTKLKNLGALDGSYVHPEIFGDMEHVAHIAGKGERTWNKALGAWKFGKVILSPKTHMRNLLSNSVLAHLGGMPMPVQPVFLTRAAKEMKNKGKAWQEIRELGGLDHTWTSGELKTLFDSIPGQISGTETMAESVGKIGAIWEGTKKVGRKAADLYEAEEQIFKVAKYLHSKSKGMAPKEAWADAEKWLFNYSKLTKFQEKYRQKWYGAPFATFTFKSLPRVAEAWVKTPWRFALPSAMILGLEEAARRQIGDTREVSKAKRELLPEWMKGSTFGLPNFVRMPFLKDDSGREYYLNLTYILPWGDIGESGKFAGIPGGVRPFSQPFLNEPIQQIMNYDKFFERQIVPEEDLAGKTTVGKLATQAKKRGGHLVRALAPTPVIDATKAFDALLKRPTRGKFKTPVSVALDVIAGVKTYPVDYIDQIAKSESKIDPETGFMARKIMSRIRSLALDKEAAEKTGGNTKFYDKQIAERLKQLEGLEKELEEVSNQATIIEEFEKGKLIPKPTKKGRGKLVRKQL